MSLERKSNPHTGRVNARKIILSKLGHVKRDPAARRIWIEGSRLPASGFAPGRFYSVNEDAKGLKLIVTPDGDKKVCVRRNKAIIDIASRFVAEKFSGFTRIKIIIFDGFIRIIPDILESEILEAKRSMAKWFNDGKVPCLDIFSGGCTSSVAMSHATDGKLFVSQHVESDSCYTEYADLNHPDSLSVNAYIQHIDPEDIEKAGVATIWVPCTDHSLQGRAKKKIGLPESGEFGYLFFHALNLLKKANVSIVLLECVPSYMKSSSMAIVRNVLKDWGFKYQDEGILHAPDFGSYTRRKRFIFMASRLGPVSFPRDDGNEHEQKLLDILDDDCEWLTPENSKSIDYFINRHGKTHTAKGNGFGIEKNSVYRDADYMPVIPRTYGKLQPAGLLRKSPSENAYRQFTPKEVLRAHQLEDVGLILPESKVRQYEILGQGTDGGMVSALAKYIMQHIAEFAGNGQMDLFGAHV